MKTSLLAPTILATLLTLVGHRAAHAEGASAEVQTKEVQSTPHAPIAFMLDVSQHWSSQDRVGRPSGQLTLGLPALVTPHKRIYLELGIGEIEAEGHAPNPTLVQIGIRESHHWGKFSLHFAGHAVHGDGIVGNKGETLRPLANLSIGAYRDLWSNGPRTMAVGLQASAWGFSRFTPEENRGTSFAASAGLGLGVW